MHPDRIAELVALLPEPSQEPDCYDLVPAASQLIPFDKNDLMAGLQSTAKYQSNLQFQYLFAIVHVNSGIPVPSHIHEPWIHRIYHAMTIPGIQDPVIVRAIMYYLRNLHSTRHKINALILGGAPREEIARLCMADEETIEAYENLFFDVRDRLDDRLFISDLIHPIDREQQEGRFSTKLYYFQVAYHYGWKQACLAMGFHPDQKKLPSTAEALEEYKEWSTREALRVARQGLMKPEFYPYQIKSWVQAKTMASATGLGDEETNRLAASAGAMIAKEIQDQTKARLIADYSGKIERNTEKSHDA